MATSFEKFKMLEERGVKALELMRQKAFKPNKEKTLRNWSITDVSKIVKKTTQCIRVCEKEGKLPSPKIDNKSKRFYTLSDINKIRDYFGILPRKGDRVAPAVIAFTNFKGGVAKTTSALHAAQYFAKSGYRVLMIDTDSQASTTSCFGYAPDEDISNQKTLLDFFTGKNKKFASLITKTYWDNLDLIPANLGLYGVELELPLVLSRAIDEGTPFKIHNILQTGIQQVCDQYDVVIIDCPPSLSILNTNALFAATALVIPVPPELPDIASMVQFFGMIRGTLGKFPKKQYSFIRVLITKNDGSDSSKRITSTLRALYGNYIMKAEMFTTQVIKKARTEMCSVYELQKYKGAQQTLNRAIQIVNNINEEIESLVWQSWGESSRPYKAKTMEKEVV